MLSDPTCRDCRAGLAQIAQMRPAFYCPTHGLITVDLISGISRDELAHEQERREKRLIAAAQRLAARYDHLSYTDAHVEVAELEPAWQQFRAALDDIEHTT